MSALSDLLNGGTISAKQAAEKAEAMGIDLPYGTLSGYWAGDHGRPRRDSLAKLALVVQFTEKQLQEAAWSTSAPLGKWTPPEESIHLDRQTRKALDSLIKSVVRAKGSSNAVSSSSSASSGTQTQAGQVQEDGLSDDGEPFPRGWDQLDPGPDAGQQANEDT